MPSAPTAIRRTCLWIPLLIAACGTAPDQQARDVDALRAELLAMQADDQRLERLVVDGAPEAKRPGFFAYKQRLQQQRATRCRKLFERHGYPGADLVGADASDAFWLLVQHADDDPSFQQRVVEAMAPVVARGDARPEHLAYLTDRVRVNTGRPQLYGTQTTFEPATGRIVPKPLEAAGEVDARRAAVGLEPLWQYVNDMVELHYRMNEARYREQGIAAPPLLPAGYSDW